VGREKGEPTVLVLLIVDNRDSFTFNLVQALRGMGQEVRVRPASTLDARAVRALDPQRIVIGPGPGRPETAGASLEIIRAFAGALPILGVCLGHQAIAVQLGARLVVSRHLKHGQTTRITHSGVGLFRGLPSPLDQTRYNSLTIDPDSLPEELEITAHDGFGEIMGVRHRLWPLEGVQFHPEAIRSCRGIEVLRNFVEPWPSVPAEHAPSSVTTASTDTPELARHAP
jgi:anthranilate synthase/aminodeoxychorismate synthase-like glutamine amidotransferase